MIYFCKFLTKGNTCNMIFALEKNIGISLFYYRTISQRHGCLSALLGFNLHQHIKLSLVEGNLSALPYIITGMTAPEQHSVI